MADPDDEDVPDYADSNDTGNRQKQSFEEWTSVKLNDLTNRARTNIKRFISATNQREYCYNSRYNPDNLPNSYFDRLLDQAEARMMESLARLPDRLAAKVLQKNQAPETDGSTWIVSDVKNIHDYRLADIKNQDPLSKDELKDMVARFGDDRAKAALPPSQAEKERLDSLTRSYQAARDAIRPAPGQALSPQQTEQRDLLDHRHLADRANLHATSIAEKLAANNSPLAENYRIDAKKTGETAATLQKELSTRFPPPPSLENAKPNEPSCIADTGRAADKMAPILSKKELKDQLREFSAFRKEAGLYRTETEIHQFQEMSDRHQQERGALPAWRGKLAPQQMEQRDLIDHKHLAERTAMQASWIANRLQTLQSPKAQKFFADARNAKHTVEGVQKQIAGRFPKTGPEKAAEERPGDRGRDTDWKQLSDDLRQQTLGKPEPQPRDELAIKLASLTGKQQARYQGQVQNAIDANGEASKEFRLQLVKTYAKNLPPAHENWELREHARREQIRVYEQNARELYREQKAEKTSAEKQANTPKENVPPPPEKSIDPVAAKEQSQKPAQPAEAKPANPLEGVKPNAPHRDYDRLQRTHDDIARQQTRAPAPAQQPQAAAQPAPHHQPTQPPQNHQPQAGQKQEQQPQQQVPRIQTPQPGHLQNTPLSRAELSGMFESFPEIRREAGLMTTGAEMREHSELTRAQDRDRRTLEKSLGEQPKDLKLRLLDLQDHQHLAELAGTHAKFIAEALKRHKSPDAELYNRDFQRAMRTAHSLHDERQSLTPDRRLQSDRVVRQDQDQKQSDKQAAAEGRMTEEQKANASPETRMASDRKDRDKSAREITALGPQSTHSPTRPSGGGRGR